MSSSLTGRVSRQSPTPRHSFHDPWLSYKLSLNPQPPSETKPHHTSSLSDLTDAENNPLTLCCVMPTSVCETNNYTDSKQTEFRDDLFTNDSSTPKQTALEVKEYYYDGSKNNLPNYLLKNNINPGSSIKPSLTDYPSSPPTAKNNEIYECWKSEEGCFNPETRNPNEKTNNQSLYSESEKLIPLQINNRSNEKPVPQSQHKMDDLPCNNSFSFSKDDTCKNQKQEFPRIVNITKTDTDIDFTIRQNDGTSVFLRPTKPCFLQNGTDSNEGSTGFVSTCQI